MKISLNWLSEYIDINDYRDRLGELSSLLTQAGLEVEEMANPAENWDKVVIGHLLEVGKHPDADKLTLCKVDVGGSEPLQIVCGAKNHKTGDSVAVATVGAVLPGDFKIKKSKIRGVESFGMLCSETELGISEEADGILLLEGDPKPGQSFADFYGKADIIFELNVTPNRADCLSHIGLARELSTLLDRPVKMPSHKLQESATSVNDFIQVELKDSESCPRYCGRVIKGVKVGESPSWLKQRLEAIGLNSVNNVVDVTNYVLFEYGQPLHAFDLEELTDSRIVIEKAQKDESFTTLDGTEVKLSEQDLVIRDGKRAVALAGVVGGQNSGVSESTKNIFLESAFFRSEGVRRTSRAHGIETDSCYRFSRGVDPERTLEAMNRAAHLIVEVAGGEIQRGDVDIYPQPIPINDILVTTEYISERLGYPVNDQEFENWMQRLGCVVAKTDSGYRISPPSYRWDLHIKEDLVEEFARLKGYDQLGETLPKLQEEPTGHVPVYTFQNRVGMLLNGLGLLQTVNYAFVNESQTKEVWGTKGVMTKLGLKQGDSPIRLLNPISEELSVMRESLLPSLLKNLVFNDHHANHFGRLFEIAPCHYKEGKGFKEQLRLAFAFWGQSEGLWGQTQKDAVVFELKSVVESLLRSIGGKSFRWDPIRPEDCPPGFHPNQSVQLFYEGKIIGILGSLHPLIKDKNKLRQSVAIAEIDFAALMSRQPRAPKFKALPKFPAVERDVAFMGSESVTADKIGAEIKKAAGPLLSHFEVFDVYQDKEMKGAGQRSIAFRLRFQSAKETLKDDEVNAIRDKIVNSLCQKLGLEIR